MIGILLKLYGTIGMAAVLSVLASIAVQGAVPWSQALHVVVSFGCGFVASVLLSGNLPGPDKVATLGLAAVVIFLIAHLALPSPSSDMVTVAVSYTCGLAAVKRV